MKKGGGLEATEKLNRKKAKMVYDAIDARGDFYRCPIDRGSRSLMNVVWNLPTEELEADFLEKAKAEGLMGLKGHRSVGGIRASIYNAVQLDWVEALADFMKRYG
jgi:phosphoserine aminotransferase